MSKQTEKMKRELSMLNAVFTGQDSANKNSPEFMKTKMLFTGVSLLAAILLWSFVAWNGNAEITRTIDIPVNYSKTAEGLDAFKNTRTVAVKVSGNMALLSRIDKSKMSAEVDLSGITAGKYDLPITIDVPSGLRISSWKPSLAEVEIYKKGEKLFRVNLKPVGSKENEAPDFISAEILPGSATVYGPVDELAKVHTLEARVPVENLKGDKPYSGELVALDEKDKLVSKVMINPKTVVVKLDEAKETAAKTEENSHQETKAEEPDRKITKDFTNIPIVLKGAKHDAKWHFSPTSVTVVAEGQKSLLDGLHDAPCEIILDVTSIVSENIKLPLIVKNVKNGIDVLRIEPEEIELKREK